MALDKSKQETNMRNVSIKMSRAILRAMGKIFKEAGRVKNILSANSHSFAQIENVMGRSHESI